MERRTLYYGGCLAALQKLGVFVLLLGLAALGGWWFEGRDKYADSGVPVREPAKGDTTPTPMVPEPEVGAGLKEIEYDLQKIVVEAAGVSSPTTVKCDVPEIPSQPRTFGCTVHYMGLQVPFHIDITDVTDAGALGLGAFNWEHRAERLVLTREGVYAKFWRERKRAGDKDLRCDRVPEKTLIRPGRTNFYCYATTKRNEHHRYVVEVSDTGMNFLFADD
jgi:hypothetical protein